MQVRGRFLPLTALLRWTAWSLAGLLGLLVLLLAGAFGLAQTEFGQRRIAALIEGQLGGPETRAEIRGLGGFIPFDIRLEGLTLADPEGVWLTLTGARLAWSPRELLRGRLHVEEIRAALVDVPRLPVGTEEEPEDGEPFRVPQLPENVPPIVVERLAVERVDLGAPVLGEAASFTLEGRMATADDGSSVTADLDLRRLDEPTAWAALDAELALGPPLLTLDLEAEETGGLLADVTGRPAAGAFRLDLSGTGPLESWRAELNVLAENLARVDADLTLAVEDGGGPTLAVAGRLVPLGDLVPAEYAPLIGDDGLGFGLTVTRAAEQQLVLEDINLVTAVARLQGRALLDLEAQRVDARGAARMDDLAPLSGLAGAPLAGALVVGIGAEGALAQPTIELDLRGDNLAVPPAVAGGAAASVRLVPLDPEAPGWSGLRVTGDGALDGLALTEGPPLPERDLRWEVAGTVLAEGPIEVERLRLSGETLQLAATGVFDPGARAGRAELRLEADDLAPLAALADQTIGGAGALTADVTVEPAAERLVVALDGRLVRLAGLPDAGAALLGAEVALGATAEIRPGDRLEVKDLRVAGAAATLTGDLALGLDGGGDRPLGGRLTLALPRLAALEPVVGEPIRGSASVVAALDGTLAAPQVRLNATGDNIVAAGQTIDELTAELTALGLPEAPRGDLSLTAKRARYLVGADAAYRLEGQTLTLADLEVSAPETRLGGALTVRLDGPLVEGRLTGTIGRLAALTPLVGGPDVAGRLSLDATLRAADGRQGVSLAVNGTDIAGDFGRVASLDVNAEVADALAEPEIEASAQLRNFRSGGTAVRRASATAAGDLDGLDVTVQAAGESAVAFDLTGAARVSRDDGTVAVRLDRLSGSLAERPVELLQPATLTVADEAARLDDLRLRLATARLRAGGSYGPDEVALRATLEALPLALLAAVGVQDLSGTANAQLALSGPAGNPRGTLTATVTGLRLNDPALEGVPAADVSLRAELAERRLSAELRAERLTDAPITARLTAPVVFTVAPFAFELPEDGALGGRLNAAARLERLDAYLALDDQDIRGLLRADLDIGGTVAAPAFTGEITLTDGRYENGFTGTVLRDIRLRATASERRIVIQELRANDGGRGRVTGSGAVALVPAENLPFELTVSFDRATLVRRDIAEATIDGRLNLAGTTAEARITGGLTVAEAELNITAAGALGGPDIAVLDVVEIGADGRAGVPEALPDAERGPPLVVGLDVRIDAPGRVFVRGRGLNSEWEGRVRVQGTAEDPRLTGRFSVKRGEFSFLDRTFNLRDGAIEFTGASPPEPTLDFAAVTPAQGFTAIVRVTGPASDPRIELASEPPLPEDEILSRLLFNRQLAEVGPAQAAQLAAAVQRLRGGGPGLLDRIRGVLGVDVLAVGGGDTPGATTVEVGKYLSDDVYVGVETGPGEASNRATVEIEVLPNVTLEGEVREDSRAGVGLQWKFDY